MHVRPHISRSIAAILAALATHLSAAPFTPKSDDQVLQKLPTRATDPVTRDLAVLRQTSTNRPRDLGARAALVQKYVDLASAQGDPRYIGYAEAAITAYAGPLDPQLLTLRGVLRQYKHDFQGALQDFGQALALDPEYAQAYAWRGAVHLVLADYPAARKACNALKALGRDALYGACEGLALSYGGELGKGYQALSAALAAANSDASRLWLHTRLGEVSAWRGDAKKARQHYRQALALGTDDVYLLAAWSDFLLDQGEAAEVIRLLTAWESVDSLLVRLAIAETIISHPKARAHTSVLSDRFAAARDRGDTTHLAEEARFELQVRKDAPTALRLAQSNYTKQREPRDARILLEAAQAAGQPEAAQEALNWLKASKFEDTRMQQLARGRP
jgi:Tfp pilus assembly protein PilF